ncbi:hypothetical protein BM1_04737 [Bipolaris maydis]|nr:hypothetical protein BM1_04737 [Bipolaris maydis]
MAAADEMAATAAKIRTNQRIMFTWLSSLWTSAQQADLCPAWDNKKAACAKRKLQMHESISGPGKPV